MSHNILKTLLDIYCWRRLKLETTVKYKKRKCCSALKYLWLTIVQNLRSTTKLCNRSTHPKGFLIMTYFYCFFGFCPY